MYYGYFKSGLENLKKIRKVTSSIAKEFKDVYFQLHTAVHDGDLDIENDDVKAMVDEYDKIYTNIVVGRNLDDYKDNNRFLPVTSNEK